jgi:2-iminobutanoate/2-iminopropanoate deaminase
MPRQPIESSGAPAPSGAYSQAIVAGDYMFLSGQGPFDTEGRLVDGTFGDQVRRVFANLAAVAAEADATLADAVRVGVYLNDMDTFDEMNTIYEETFPRPLPARTTIQTPLPGFGIEVDAVIYLGI